MDEKRLIKWKEFNEGYTLVDRGLWSLIDNPLLSKNERTRVEKFRNLIENISERLIQENEKEGDEDD